MTDTRSTLRQLLVDLGPVRTVVATIALACLPMVLFSDASKHGIGIIPSQVAPGIAVLLIWALPFDMLMARVFMADKMPTEQARYRLAIRVDLLLEALLIITWLPFFWSLLTP